MKNILIPFILLGFLTGSCENKSSDNDTPGQQTIDNLLLNPKAETVISASNEFGFDIFREINTDAESEENLFISPTSISIALAMTYNGAEGDTKDSIASVLRMKGMDPDALNQVYKDLIAGLVTLDDKVMLSIANSIWYRQNLSVKETFIETNQEYYDAEVAALDFSDPSAKDIINGWVEDKTNDKIHDLVSEIEPDNVMFLINAIYFNGIWKKEFNKEDTYDEIFRVNDQKNVNVNMMQMADTINYTYNDMYQAIELDYGTGNYSMVVMLPQEGSSVSDIIALLQPYTWNELLENMHKVKVNVRLPKFKFDYEKRLNDILIRMGMGIAFGFGPTDFSGITDQYDLAIDYVKHKSFVDVNEEGTEAAAATVVAIKLTSTDTNEIYFTANKPFVFAIREKNTGAVVFIGKVMNPATE